MVESHQKRRLTNKVRDIVESLLAEFGARFTLKIRELAMLKFTTGFARGQPHGAKQHQHPKFGARSMNTFLGLPELPKSYTEALRPAPYPKGLTASLASLPTLKLPAFLSEISRATGNYRMTFMPEITIGDEPAQAAPTELPSSSAVKINPDKTASITDEKGRLITVKRLSTLERMRLFRVIGGDASENRQYMGYAALATSVTSIDGMSAPFPTSLIQLEAKVSQLGDEGFEAAAEAIASLSDAFLLKSGLPLDFINSLDEERRLMSRNLGDLLGGVGFFAGLAKSFEGHKRELEAAAAILEAEAKSYPGTYQDGWAALAESTIAQKQTGDSPLLETGEMRDSIAHNSDEHVAYVGSNNPKMTWQELGTDRIPPRPVLGLAMIKAKDKVEAAVGKIINATTAKHAKPTSNAAPANIIRSKIMSISLGLKASVDRKTKFACWNHARTLKECQEMAEAYEIGIKMMMSGNVAEALGLISHKLLGIHGSVKDIEKNLGNWKTLAIGAGAAFAGIELGKGLLDVVEHGAKLNHYVSQLEASGYKQEQIAQIVDKAWATTTENMNTGVAENVKNLHHLSDVTGNYQEAIKNFSIFTKFDTVFASLKDDDMRAKFHGNEMQTYNLARTLESLGKTQNEADIQRYGRDLLKGVIGFRGLVDGNMLYKAVTNAGGRQMDWSEEFITGPLFPLIQELGAGKAANAMYMLQAGLGQGRVTKYAAMTGEKYGLWHSDGRDENRDEKGRFLGMKADSIVGAQLLKENPYRWVGEVMLPTLKAHGVDTKEKLSTALDALARNKTLSAAAKMLTDPNVRAQIEKDLLNMARVPDDAVDILQKKDPSLAIKAFTSQWDNFLISLGQPMVQTAVDSLNKITGAINYLATQAGAHPDWVKAIDSAAALSAALLTIGGSLTVIRAALSFSGLAAGAATLPGAAVQLTGAAVALDGAAAKLSISSRSMLTFAATSIYAALHGPNNLEEATKNGKAWDESITATLPAWLTGQSWNGLGSRWFDNWRRGGQLEEDRATRATGMPNQGSAKPLQADIKSTNTVVFTVDGQKIADAIYSKVERHLVNLTNGLSIGATDISHHMSPGTMNP
eukprot:gene12169-12257_t